MTSGLLWVALLLIHSFALPKTTIVKVMICRRVPDIMKNSVFSARVQTIKINIGNICDVQIIKGDNYLQIIKANLQDNQALDWCVCFRGWSPGYVHCSASLAQEIERGTAFDLKKKLYVSMTHNFGRYLVVIDVCIYI